MTLLERSLVQWAGRWIRHKLLKTSSEPDPSIIRKAAMDTFYRTARGCPAYKELLKIKGVRADQISFDEWTEKVPVIDKADIFGAPALKELVENGDFGKISSYLVSSGTSGTFAFGLKTKKELDRNTFETDVALEVFYSACSKKTLMINCMPMGSRAYTRLPMVEVGAHSTRALAAIRRLSPSYDQILLAGIGHLFIKRLIEEGVRHGMDWSSCNIHFLSGGEFFPEAVRSSLSRYWPDLPGSGSPPRWSASAGVTELYLNAMFFETPETIAVRQEAHRNASFRKALTGSESLFCPIIFSWDPKKSHIEILGPAGKPGEIVVTNMDRTAVLQLVRYNLHDFGRVCHKEELGRILESFGLTHLKPKIALPWIFFYGRGPEKEPLFWIECQGELHELIYREPSLTPQLTGNFKILSGSWTPGSPIPVLFQASSDSPDPVSVKMRLQKLMDGAATKPFAVDVKSFHSFQTGMDLSFENKCQNFEN